MSRSWLYAALVCAAVQVACGAGPTEPSGPPRLSRTRFLAFGDSITAGEVTTPVALTAGITKHVIVPSASYPSVLQGQLQSTYAAQSSAIEIINQGKPGEFILDGRLRFEEVFPQSAAQVVLLMEGVVGLDFVGPDTSTEVMRDMVKRARSVGARVFVGSMIPSPLGRPRSVPAERLTTYNARLRTMCTEEGVTYVDVYTGLLQDVATLIGSDGLHPTEAGYRRIAESFFAAIQRELQLP
jgi:lysophospholipase L1-like esterase